MQTLFFLPATSRGKVGTFYDTAKKSAGGIYTSKTIQLLYTALRAVFLKIIGMYSMHAKN